MPNTKRAKILAACLVAAGAFVASQAAISSGVPDRRSASAQKAPKSVSEIKSIINGNAAAAKFDGVIHGWRVAPYEILSAEGLADRNLNLSCDASSAGAETATELDFTLTYLPPALPVERVSGPSKWVCDGAGLSVAYEYTLVTPYGGGILWAERAVWGRRAVEVLSASDRVEAGSINGRPAIFIHPADDESGLGGQPVIIVIEDDSAPQYTILRVAGDQGISFSELVKIAEGAK